jgi:hypothetical protein
MTTAQHDDGEGTEMAVWAAAETLDLIKDEPLTEGEIERIQAFLRQRGIEIATTEIRIVLGMLPEES